VIARHVAVAAIVLSLAPASTSRAQKRLPGDADGPASAELRAMRRSEQARPPLQRWTPQQARVAEERERVRRQRVGELLAAGKLTTQEDYEIAAAVFQRGQSADDQLTAHELAVISGVLGASAPALSSNARVVFGSMPALAEDGFLQRIGRAPRFDITAASRDATAVTDGLRTDSLVPSFKGRPDGDVRVPRLQMNRRLARVMQRMDPGWQAKAATRPVSRELARLAAAGHFSARVIEIYRDDQLWTADDYHNAALVLRRRGDADAAILAHEMAVVAAMRGKVEARRLAAETLDQFLVAVGRPQRYGTVAGKPLGTPAADAVRAHLGLTRRSPRPAPSRPEAA
jgi:hypothetical protein